MKETCTIVVCQDDLPDIPKEIIESITVEDDPAKFLGYMDNGDIVCLNVYTGIDVAMFCFDKNHLFDYILNLNFADKSNIKILVDRIASETFKNKLNKKADLIKQENNIDKALDLFMQLLNDYENIIFLENGQGSYFAIIREKEVEDDWVILGQYDIDIFDEGDLEDKKENNLGLIN